MSSRLLFAMKRAELGFPDQPPATAGKKYTVSPSRSFVRGLTRTPLTATRQPRGVICRLAQTQARFSPAGPMTTMPQRRGLPWAAFSAFCSASWVSETFIPQSSAASWKRNSPFSISTQVGFSH